jgi:hypothetical protein
VAKQAWAVGKVSRGREQGTHIGNGLWRQSYPSRCMSILLQQHTEPTLQLLLLIHEFMWLASSSRQYFHETFSKQTDCLYPLLWAGHSRFFD